MKDCNTIMKFFEASNLNVTAGDIPCLGNTIENSNLSASEILFIDNTIKNLILSPSFVNEKNL